MTKNESETVIEESGVFKRTYHRKGKKKRVKTERQKKNPLKVTIGKIGELEVYVYPYEYPEKVFLGQYPQFTMVLSKDDLPRWFSTYNILRWYFNGEWQNKRKQTKQAKRARQAIVLAYNLGLKRQKEKAKHEKKTQL